MRGFRVWSDYWKEYATEAELHMDGSVDAIFEDADGVPHHENTDLVVEFGTWLKDKNGKETYEGDILEQFVCGVKTFKGKPCGRRTIWQVRWNDKECCFELHYLRSIFGDSLMSCDDEYEVIGNIHENHELLEEE